MPAYRYGRKLNYSTKTLDFLSSDDGESTC
jgi:hypothetical protein